MAMHNDNGSTAILSTDPSVNPLHAAAASANAASASTYSLDTHDTGTTAMDTMDMDEDFTWNGNGSPGARVLDPMDDTFNMIGFNDDFSTFGVMGALSRNSSGSFKDLNGGLNLKSSFSDNFAFPE